MKKLIKIYFIMLIFLAFGAKAQMSKGEKGTFALTNATVVTVSNGTIENATVIISNGMIMEVGANVTVPEGATTIDCAGHYIYPGMIDSGTNVGLVEVGSLAETRDNSEIGSVKPHIQALTAINPNSTVIPVTRVGGITTVLTNPEGGLIPGTSALINLHGYTPEQMYAGFKGMRINFPNSGRRGRRDRRSDDEIKKALEKALKELNDVWGKATEYSGMMDAHNSNSTNPKPDYYPEMEAMIPVIKGEIPVLIEVNAAKDIQAALTWIKDNEVNAILTGVAEGWRVADEIAEAGVSVITGPMFSTPTRSSDRYDRRYANPGIMAKAGVKVAIRTAETENARNLPFNAGFAVAYGMEKDEAIKAVTLNPAEIFGLGDQLGSIEKGKMANLVVTDGDLFETKTTIVHLFISGWQIPIDSRHIRLYEEFLERSPGLSK